MKNTSGNDNCVEELCSVEFKEIVHFFFFFLNSEHSVTHTGKRQTCQGYMCIKASGKKCERSGSCLSADSANSAETHKLTEVSMCNSVHSHFTHTYSQGIENRCMNS